MIQADEMGLNSLECARSVPTHNSAAPPFAELPAAGPELFEEARKAVGAIRHRGREGNGRFGMGNGGALKTGLRSRQLIDAPEVGQWHAEAVALITGDLGGSDELSHLSTATVREAARLEVILEALGQDLLVNGTLTAKGRQRAALTAYLGVLAQFARLTNQLGLSRKPKPVATLEQVMRGGQ
ncbi:MAG: hypothetical protein ABI051_03330 [Vicinamibacterales bacterium]